MPGTIKLWLWRHSWWRQVSKLSSMRLHFTLTKHDAFARLNSWAVFPDVAIYVVAILFPAEPTFVRRTNRLWNPLGILNLRTNSEERHLSCTKPSPLQTRLILNHLRSANATNESPQTCRTNDMKHTCAVPRFFSVILLWFSLRQWSAPSREHGMSLDLPRLRPVTNSDEVTEAFQCDSKKSTWNTTCWYKNS